MQLGINNQVFLDKKKHFIGDFNFYMQPPGVGKGEQIMRGYYDIAIGLKAMLLDNKLTIGFNGFNILKSHQSNGSGYSPDGVYYSFNNYYNDRQFIFSLSYKFGNNQLKSNIKPSARNEDIERTR